MMSSIVQAFQGDNSSNRASECNSIEIFEMGVLKLWIPHYFNSFEIFEMGVLKLWILHHFEIFEMGLLKLWILHHFNSFGTFLRILVKFR